MNIVILFGTVSSAPDLRVTQNQNPVLSFRVETTKRFIKDGEQREVKTWNNCVVWGARAQQLSSELYQGAAVMLRGELQSRKYSASDGTERYITEVNCGEVSLVSAPSDF